LFLCGGEWKTAQAEPWLSTKFAQNCAGCHSPGRYNTEMKDRRCSLSCQGCHVSPNGGGLRSAYGKWTETYWLRSFRSGYLKNKKNFAKMEDQPSASLGPVTFEKEKKGKRGKRGRRSKRGNSRKSADKKISIPKHGLPMTHVKGHPMDEKDFYRDGREYEVVPRSMWLANVLDPDPYREVDQTTVDAGGDLRYQLVNYEVSQDGETIVPSEQKAFFMVGDFGVRWRPLHRNLHIVSETRMRGAPSDDRTFSDTLYDIKPRALYAMVDDLPYNTYVMSGYFRPMFGNYVPDHTALAQTMQSFAMTGSTKSYDILYNATTIGTAPNVPYLNLHYIGKQVSNVEKNDRTKGFMVSTGLRFVSYGAAVNYFLWKTDDDRPDQSTSVQMQAMHVAGTYGPVIASIEATSMVRDNDIDSFRQGGVYTLDTQTKIWRENYFLLSYATANTTSQLTPGATVQSKIGLRSFVVSGLDVSLSVDNQVETSKTDQATTETEVNGYSMQVHVFF